ncbi:Sulfite reductase [NADPH] flavoprotein alpha-component [Marinomonas gallaica]|uniref:NADPH--hemoprotein reductase n=1 Tax=Marinomonas gallaica TaxID=1806667 RepID=A0A1C3JLY8_9GAMM|nr:flavodoxin domain-containing protein [Marinomonas gallaica]SBT16020.1 Sulfite reductase [NADPH] flavoprotein alpha-component [Marinomonas gallaica]SBT21068.1 Sulfite reductase [NADPH] flavoprotein alpha-component [Marinomonas gallaica]
MSWWFTKLIQQLNRMMYMAGGVALFILLYVWSVLSASKTVEVPLEARIPEHPLFSLAEHSVYRFSHDLVAQVDHDVLGYVFSTQEWYWLKGLSLISQCLLWGVVVIGLLALTSAPIRRYGFSMVLMAAVVLNSRVFDLDNQASIHPWWALFLIIMPMLAVYVDIKKQLPMRPGQRLALIAYASQTGSAKRLAEQLHETAQSLLDVRCVSQLTTQQLLSYQKVFFVVSTQGNGDAPDTAHSFLRDIKKQTKSNVDTEFSVLALGDRTYNTFCAFGHQLTDLLRQKGFKLALPTQEVDRMDVSAVDHWWQQICGRLGIVSDTVSMQYDTFTVVSNECLNPMQTHRHVHRIRLYCSGARYRAGDLLAVQADETNEPERLYSIASYEKDYVELLVRRHLRSDGHVGLVSGRLSAMESGDLVKASIREHEAFHLVDDVPLIMIGAGTGLAPFVGFLKQKQAWQSQTPSWLIFGEQYAQYDDYFSHDLKALKHSGVLTRMDSAWSRPDGDYVQTLLKRHQAEVRQWLAQGAHIYLCGSREGFGNEVCHTLQQILSDTYFETRLHTDLY